MIVFKLHTVPKSHTFSTVPPFISSRLDKDFFSIRMQQLSPDLDFSGILLERLQVAVNCWLGSFRVQVVDSTGALVKPADRVRHTVLVHVLVKD